jgi:hypothetical protein
MHPAFAVLHHGHPRHEQQQQQQCDRAQPHAAAIAAAAAAASAGGGASSSSSQHPAAAAAAVDSVAGGVGSNSSSSAHLQGILLNGPNSRPRSPAMGVSPCGSMKSVGVPWVPVVSGDGQGWGWIVLRWCVAFELHTHDRRRAAQTHPLPLLPSRRFASPVKRWTTRTLAHTRTAAATKNAASRATSAAASAAAAAAPALARRPTLTAAAVAMAAPASGCGTRCTSSWRVSSSSNTTAKALVVVPPA